MSLRRIWTALKGKKPEEQQYQWAEGQQVFTRTLTESRRAGDKKKPVTSRTAQADNAEEKSTFITTAESTQVSIAAPNQNAEVPKAPLDPRELITQARGSVVENIKLIETLEEKGFLTDIKKYAKERSKEKPDDAVLQQLLNGMNLSVMKVFNDALVSLKKLQDYFTVMPAYVFGNQNLVIFYASYKTVYLGDITKKLEAYQNETVFLRQILEKNNQPAQAPVSPAPVEVVKEPSPTSRRPGR